MAGRVFISYRREDSKGEALALRKTLAPKLRGVEIFMDTDGGIRPGENFVRVIDERVAGAGAVLVLIGPRWVDATDSRGRRRLDSPDDFVRIEVFSALKRDIPVLPVLLDEARMPAEAELPELIRLLSNKQALRVRHDRFDADVEGVAGAVGRLLAAPPRPGVASWQVAAAALAALAAGATAIPWTLERAGLPPLGMLLQGERRTEAEQRLETALGDIKRLTEANQLLADRTALEKERTSRERAIAEKAERERKAARTELDRVRHELRQSEKARIDALAKQKAELEAGFRTAQGAAAREAEAARTAALARLKGELEAKVSAAEARGAKAEGEVEARRKEAETARKEQERVRRDLWDRLLAVWSKTEPNLKAAEDCLSKSSLHEVVEACTKAIALDAKSHVAYGRRAFAFVNLGEYARAQADASRVIDGDPKDASGWRRQSLWNRGLSYERTGDIDRAIDDYGARIRIDNNATMHLWRAALLLRRNNPGDRDLAAADLRAVIGNDKADKKDRDTARERLRHLGAGP
jgi:tetratricopeptide (TPR) repeat protein